ncbi:hypothetical protein [Jeotgalibacillus sp. R-1-5s-1]|uniref:hypothetical protein n=1 Tax=Jeotgalibacillus sp. R-1-5s-1 TaxID=2555897 RepID=UPI00106D65F5|nr:hypothetical protein [Jeotgalibacillus sp. R-1-5s-1]TFD99885.1 hypothetical protein E2491_05410 [Jeotgalibacillus sp. R-1-5s-1]
MKLKKSAKRGLWVIGISVLAIFVLYVFVGTPSFDHAEAEEYLENEIAWTNEGGVVTDAFKVYGGNEEEIYVWYAFEEFITEQNDIGGGASIAVKLIIEDGIVIDHQIPEDGSLYTESMKELFPFHVRWRMPQAMPLSLEKAIALEQAKLLAAFEEEQNQDE